MNRKIQNMSLLCAVLVVGIHVRWPEGDAFGWFGYHFIKEGIARIAVPFFFIVSGFFLARHFNETGWWRIEVVKRVKSLVIPFYVWSLISVLVTIPFSIAADMMAHRPFGSSVASGFPGVMAIFAFDLTKDPVLIPLWYVRCLFLFALTSFAVGFLVSRMRVAWLSLLYCLALVLSFMSSDSALYGLFDHGYSLWGLFYFSLGAYLAIYGAKPCKPIVATSFWVIGCSLMVARAFALQGCDWTHELAGMLMVPFMLYAVWCIIPARRMPDFLATCPLPIYLMHGIVFIILGLLWKHIHLENSPSIQALVMYVTGVCVPVLAFAGFRKWTPKAALFLFGGRG